MGQSVPPWTRTLSYAGSAKRICQKSLLRWKQLVSVNPAQGRLLTLRPAPARIRASLEFPLHAAWLVNCAKDWLKRVTPWMRPYKIFISKSVVVSIHADSITLQILDSMASADIQEITQCHTSRLCWEASGLTTPVHTVLRWGR